MGGGGGGAVRGVGWGGEEVGERQVQGKTDNLLPLSLLSKLPGKDTLFL